MFNLKEEFIIMLAVITVAFLFSLLPAFLLMVIWNWLLVGFGLPAINFWMAWLIVFILKLIIG